MTERRYINDSEMAGEFFVMEVLYRLGHQPALTVGKAKSIDILVRTKGGKLIEVSVKTVRGGGKWPIGNDELSERNRLIFVLLHYTDFSNVRTQPDAFVIPAPSVAKLREPWFQSQAVYFSNTKRRDRIKAFKDAWKWFDK